VALWNSAGASVPLTTIPDTSAPSLTQYQAAVTIPSGTASGNYILQATYNTHALLAPPQFYQCSDVQVL
jgi:predicted carbohydrate-binding protein with CBM5 and CBM33 domain